MAEIRPFKGIRYNQAKVGDLSGVVAPPYDVISPEDQPKYYDGHPNNVIRLILPKGDGDKYRSAAECLNDWLETGILIQDDMPCLYAYRQEYVIGSEKKRRLGLTCALRLEDYERRTVLPHENILAGPRADRLNLLRATRVNLDSVFALHADAGVPKVLAPVIAGAPDASAVDKDGVKSELWRISDREAIEAIQGALDAEQVLIADGHHRYAAALAYRDEMRTKAGVADSDASYEYLMMTLVSLEDEGLVILPTHRVVRGVLTFDVAWFLSRLEEFFDIEEKPANGLLEAIETAAPTAHVFGLHLQGGRSYVLTLKPTVNPERVIDSPGSNALKQLDVSILHSLILERLLGIGDQQLASQVNLTYKRDAAEALRLVSSGESQMAFLINPPRVEEVEAVAAAGDRMPQKSTFFYPKLLTGTVMRRM